MATAEQFLQLLKEKDLVADSVLEAARLEAAKTSPPPDAIGVSLWLVQGHHITAAQAERLLAAVMQQAAEPRVQPAATKPTAIPDAPLPHPPVPQRLQSQRPPSNTGTPGIAGRATQPAAASKPSPSAAKSDLGDLDLAPLEQAEGGSERKAAKPAPPVQPTAEKSAAAPAAKPQTAKPGGAKATAIDSELESLDADKGPLDSLIESEGLADGLDDSSFGPAVQPTGRKKFKLRRFLKNLFRRTPPGARSKTVTIKPTDPRQVKIVIVSWGIAIVLVLGALITASLFMSGNPAEKARKIEEAVEQQKDVEAIKAADGFLKSYPKATEVDQVRALRTLSLLRVAMQQANSSGDWLPAFDMAQTEMKALPNNRAPELLQKIGLALGQIAEGLAKQTQGAPDAKGIERLQALSKLIRDAIPADRQPTKLVDEFNRIMSQCEHVVDGGWQLQQTVRDIRNAAGDGDPNRAYTDYRDLAQSYPELTDKPELAAAMQEVSDLQKAAVKPDKESLAATNAARPSDLLAAMPLAVRSLSGEVADGRGKLQFVVYEGTAFGLDAATGKVLWRRFLGVSSPRAANKPPSARNANKRANDEPLAASALPLSDADGGDAILCDPVHQELLRVKGATGELLWRLEVGRPFAAAPVRAGKSVLLLTQDRRLLFIGVADGAAERSLRLPQAVRLPPTIDAAHGLIFLLADESNLYVLARGACRQVLYLGHAPGAVPAGPLVAGDSLLVPVNDGATTGSIRVLAITGEKGSEQLQTVQRLPIPGRIATAAVLEDGGAVVVTRQGGVVALARNPSGGAAAFGVAAQLDAVQEDETPRFVVPAGREFWLTGRPLTRYGIESDSRRIEPHANVDVGLDIVRPPVIGAGTMYVAGQKPGLPGVTLSAIDLAKNVPVWQTWLAAPVAATPHVGSKSGELTVATASGGVFRLAPADFHAGAAIEATLAIDAARLTRPVCCVLPLPDDCYALSSGADTQPIAIYDPREPDKQFRWLRSPRELATAPSVFAGGILAPCIDGRVCLLDPRGLGDQGMLAKPYQPALQGVKVWEWQTPQAAGDALVVLSDGDHRLITLDINSESAPALTEANPPQIASQSLASPIAVLGKSVFVADATGDLLSFQLPELSPGKTQTLGGHCTWGPERVGKLVLTATDNDRLTAVDEKQQIVWQTNLSHGPLAGTPFTTGDEIYLSSKDGAVWRISAADGKEQGKVDAGCPLATGPVIVGGRVFVGSRDGSLLEVKKP